MGASNKKARLVTVGGAKKAWVALNGTASSLYFNKSSYDNHKESMPERLCDILTEEREGVC